MFLEGPVRIASPLGELELGVVDAEVPGVAEGVSRLLHRSIQDARAEAGGHLPSWLVDDIERNYISPEKVRTLWATTGHRFVLRLGEEIVGTIHIAKSETMILTVDRHVINVDESAHPGFKPPRHHHVVNVSVKHELRRAKLGTLMVDGILEHFRHLFSGIGLWVRADPPWHPGLAGLGFVHDPALDVFLRASVERTAGIPHPEFNQRYACACGQRRPEMDTHKLQYVSMTRAFERAATAQREVRAPSLRRETLRDAGPWSSTADVVRPATIDAVADVLAWASRERRKVTIRGQGQSYHAASLGNDVVLGTDRLQGIVARDDERVTVRGGTTWRTLLTELAADDANRFPPVVPSWIESSVGGTLASQNGGIGKGSLHHGSVREHVDALLVITGDGRRVACSSTQARWLFDAVLSGRGRFGVIAEATLRLAERPRFVERSFVDVDADDVANALTSPDLEHASAEWHYGRFRVFLTHPAARGIPVAEYLVPARTPVDGPRLYGGADLGREGLARFLKGMTERPQEVAQTLRVHPIRKADGEFLFVTRGSWRRGPFPDLIETTTWEKLYGARANEARLAKGLADPNDILGPTNYVVGG